MKLRTKLLICLLLIFTLTSCKHKTDNQRYLLMLSLDGFRWDYTDKANTPTFDSIAENGVRSTLIPVFPTVTFPNHYAMATGLYAENHGIIHNHFYNYELDKKYSMGDREAMYNPDFYQGEPIWNTAEKQGIITASYFWVGSETPIQGKHQTYWKQYDQNTRFESITDTVIHWLNLPEEKRPRFISFYYYEPDNTGHHYGPESPEVKQKVEYLDSLLGVFFKKLNQLELAERSDVMIVSDHGMAEIPENNILYLEDYVNTEWIENYYGGGPVYLIKAKDGFVDSLYVQLKDAAHSSVFYPHEVPEHLHYSNNINIQDFVIVADSAYSFDKKNNPYKSIGKHGHDNKNTDMHAMYYAIGPSFKKNYKKSAFENVHLYALMAEILGIEPAKTDGNLEKVSDMLKN